MHQVLLDSNIVIYLLNKEMKVISFIEKFKQTIFCISKITWIEVLAGSHNHQKTIPELMEDLTRFTQISIHDAIGLMAARLIQTDILYGRKNEFQDSVIAATAIVHKTPLITNNPKDFRRFKGLKVIAVK